MPEPIINRNIPYCVDREDTPIAKLQGNAENVHLLGVVSIGMETRLFTRNLPCVPMPLWIGSPGMPGSRVVQSLPFTEERAMGLDLGSIKRGSSGLLHVMKRRGT